MRVYNIPREILKQTQQHFINASARGIEGLVFWTGTPDGKVSQCFIPKQSATATFVSAHSRAVADMMFDCANRGEIVLAQVHSHLGTAFHSQIDNNGAVCWDVGFWSVVVSNGGRCDVVNGEGIRVYEHIGHQQWREVTGKELELRLKILEDMYDRSIVFSTRVGSKGNGPLRLLVSLSEDMAYLVNGQMMLIHALTLLPRISERYTTLDIVSPEGIPCKLPIGEGQTLGTVALNLLRNIQPYGTYRHLTTSEGVYSAALQIGHSSPCCTPTVFINSDGWIATAGKKSLKSNTECIQNIIGAQGAAALGVARLYSWLEGIRMDDDTDIAFNFFHLKPHVEGMSNPEWSGILDCDTPIHVVGGGALTNSMLHLLRYIPSVKCTFTITEPEALDLTNNNRYVLMTYNNGVQQLHKSDLISQSCTHHPGVRIDTDNTKFNSASQIKHDIVITAVDRVEPRLLAQKSLPSILLNGGTNGSQFGISLHSKQGVNRKTGRCVGCVTGKNDEPERRLREGTISFVSSLAGICLGAKLIKELVFPREISDVQTTFDAFGMNWPLDSSGLPPNANCPLYHDLHN